MKSLNIALIGYGKMGKTIENLALAKSHNIVLKTSSSNPLSTNQDLLSNVDVAIEFTGPDVAADNLEILANHGINTVCGSTAWLDAYDRICNHFKEKKAAFLYASNFSIGVNIFFSVNNHLAKLMNKLEEYEVKMTEAHHIQKKDAPSGTAVSLAEQITAQLDRKSSWQMQSGDERMGNSQIPIKAIREADIKGMHKVEYISKIDQISIMHEAFSREGFASGALLAAEWLYGKQGIFNMNDVLDI